jgi:hypothetical protein
VPTNDNFTSCINYNVKLEHLDMTVLLSGVGEVRVVGGELQHADKCGGECSTRKNAFVTT